MRTLLVVDSPDRWPLRIDGAELVPARRYVADGEYSALRGALVVNLCRSYAYQRMGYYVSLLAEARGHRPQPSVATLQDFRQRAVTRVTSDDLAGRIQRHLGRLKSSEFVLSIYFGQPLARTHQPLARALFEQFPAPLLRARFRRQKGMAWELLHVGPIAGSDVPAHHQEFVTEAARSWLATRPRSRGRRRPPRHHLAILTDPQEALPPSDEGALRRFERAARDLDVATVRLTRHHLGRVAEFDGLFLRATTAVNHYTFRFARKAAAEGLVVLDDPLSIIRCTNKVYLSELLHRHRIRQPRTRLVHRGEEPHGLDDLGPPYVLKMPDSSASRGVVKVESDQDADAALARYFADSSIVLAQEFLPTDYDWRVGVLDRKPLYVCRYFMVKGHWQILHHGRPGRPRYGRVESVRIEDAPPTVVRLALRAANAIGDGLYGVDIKESGRRRYVIEVNDNPTIESGLEDGELGMELYRRVLGVFIARMDARRRGRGGGR